MTKKGCVVWKKLTVLFLMLCLAVSLSGCGGDDGSKENAVHKGDTMGVAPEDDYAGSENQGVNDNDGEVKTDSETGEAAEEEGDAASAKKNESEGEKKKEESGSAQQQKVTKEMLVYRGNVVIDTTHFDQSVEEFKQMLNQAGGFVETENFSDDLDLSDYIRVEEEEKHNLYTATIRVPSAQYDFVLNGTGNLGDVRSKSSNVQNVTQKYSTYQSQIKIYEAEYQRYLKLLEKASEDEYALQIEQKLFDLQVKIAEMKSGITNLETDVAYSYIEITIKEVREYQSEPESKDTFLDRLKHTCKTSWKVFLYLIEKILFCIIYTFYYIVFILVLLFVIYKLRKRKGRVRQYPQGKPMDFHSGAGNHAQMNYEKPEDRQAGMEEKKIENSEEDEQ